MKPKNICFVNSIIPWGGGEKWHYENALLLQENKYNISFITRPESVLFQKLQPNKAIHLFGIKIAKWSVFNPLKIFKIYSFLKENQIDTILLNFPNDLKIMAVAAKLANVPNIIYRRGSDIPIKYSFTNKLIFHNAITHMIANSVATSKSINVNSKGRDLFPKEKIKIIYNHINFNKDNSSDTTLYQKTDPEELILGNVGRIDKQKYQEFLVYVSEKLLQHGVKHKIIIAGTGKLETQLKKLIADKKLESQFIFSGFLNDVSLLYNTIDLFLLPSLWEGFGYVIAEASAHKKPTIAFNISSMPELIDDGKTGFIVPLNDLNLFCEKIIYFYKNRSELKTFGESAYQFSKDRFSKEVIVNDFLNYIQNL
ncbi:glycosyltransferase [Flavobacterium algicola]|uniref:glycosyltransferase n=1 Tax=Flavobacterium algicola TaxID=556529 RepID=UPI001EFD829F|nr:glycosyltransferase [Flavobacterium algicola]MCG9791095.1 glycosyltransferase [Flavobacterium algicola]